MSLYTDLEGIPYVNPHNADPRRLILLPFFDKNEWKVWTNNINATNEKNSLVAIKAVDIARSEYISREPAKKVDCYIDFVDNLLRCFSYETTRRTIIMLLEHCRGMCACPGKLRLLHESPNADNDLDTIEYAWTEIEGIAILARSVFDFLQKIISRILNSVQWANNCKCQNIPELFSDVVYQKNKKVLRTADELEKKYNLQRSIVECYMRHVVFFSTLRTFRNSIVHGYFKNPIVYSVEYGFCINPNNEPFKSFNWSCDMLYAPNLAPVIPWVTWVMKETFSTCSDMTNTIKSLVEMRPVYLDEYRVFSRSLLATGFSEIYQSKSNKCPPAPTSPST